MKTKKCLTCWTRIKQQDWKTKDEKERCLKCRCMIRKIELFVKFLQLSDLKRDFELRWNWVKKK